MKKILLIDFYNLFIRNFHVVEVTNIDGEHYGGVFGTLRGIKDAIGKFLPDEAYVVIDGEHSGLRRKLKNRGYKANRTHEFKKGGVKAYDFLNESERQDNFQIQLKRLGEYFETLPIKVIRIPYVEADDVIAEIAHVEYDKGNEIVIYSTDSDFKQLTNDRIVCYNPTTKFLTTEQSFVEKFGYLPCNYIYFKCVNGDSSDGIPGIKGIGEKTFLKLFPCASTKRIQNISELVGIASYAVDSKLKEYKSLIKKYQLILDNEKLLQENWGLMQLQMVDISAQAKDQIYGIIDGTPQNFNRTRLRMMFLHDKLNHQVKYFDGWISSFVVISSKNTKEKLV